MIALICVACFLGLILGLTLTIGIVGTYTLCIFFVVSFLISFIVNFIVNYNGYLYYSDMDSDYLKDVRILIYDNDLFLTQNIIILRLCKDKSQIR